MSRDIKSRAESTACASPAAQDDTQEATERQQMDANYSKLLKEYNDLADGYEKLKKQFEQEMKFHQEQTSQNATVMADMQDTINSLKLQLNDALAGRSLSPGVRIVRGRYTPPGMYVLTCLRLFYTSEGKLVHNVFTAWRRTKCKDPETSDKRKPHHKCWCGTSVWSHVWLRQPACQTIGCHCTAV